MALARQGQVILPLREPHGLMCFFTLAANLGTPCATQGPGDLIDASDGARVIELLAELVELISDNNFDMDPIAASEAMAAKDSSLALMPLGYGYVSYALDGFRPHRLHFADIPVAGESGPIGSAVGGTGIAVSARRSNAELAKDYAYWVAGGEIQRSIYPSSGGQPGHGSGWEDAQVNARTANFYTGTRATLEGGWLRPRHNGYMAFQQKAPARLNQGLRNKENARAIVSDLNTMFRESF